MTKDEMFAVESAPEEQKELFGHSTNIKCPECGCLCYENRRGDLWCSWIDCSYQKKVGR